MGGVIGIDLGTTNTVVATMRDGRVHVLADDEGHRLLPSVVSFHPNGEVLVGRAAKQRRAVDGKNTVASFKRFYGLSWGSDEIERARMRFPFEMREGPESSVIIAARGQEYSLSEIGAFVLKRAKQIAEAAMGEPVDKAVITVPAHFNELQRTATKVAGRVAGLEVLRILNEPTAAALAYGLTARRDHERTCVYDFGGGTFDCTILDLSGDIFEVLSTAGDTFLGGDDIDGAIAERMAEAFLHEHRWDPRTDRQAFERLRLAAERVKVDLTRKSDTTIQIRELTYGVGGKNLDLTFSFARSELDYLLAPLVERTFTVTQEAMNLAGQTITQVDRVVLVGGSTRSPYVKQRVQDFFGVPPLDRVNPDEVVAIGAAIQAASLADQTRVRGIPKPPVPTRARALRGDQASITLEAPKGAARAAASVLGASMDSQTAVRPSPSGAPPPVPPMQDRRTDPTSPTALSPAPAPSAQGAPSARTMRDFGEEPSLGLPQSSPGYQELMRGDDPSVTKAVNTDAQRALQSTMIDQSIVTQSRSVPPTQSYPQNIAHPTHASEPPPSIPSRGSMSPPAAVSTQRSGFEPEHDRDAETEWGGRSLPTVPRRDRVSAPPAAQSAPADTGHMSLRGGPSSHEPRSLPPPLPRRATQAPPPDVLPSALGFGSLPADPFGSMPPQMYQPSVPPPQEGFAPPHPFTGGFGSEPPAPPSSAALPAFDSNQRGNPGAFPSSMPPAPFQSSPPAPYPPAHSAAPPPMAPPGPSAFPSRPPQQPTQQSHQAFTGGSKAPTFPPLELDRGGAAAPMGPPGYDPSNEPLPGLPPAQNPGTAVSFGSYPSPQYAPPQVGGPILHQGNDLRRPPQQAHNGQPVLVDVTPRALVVETAGGYCDVVLPRNAKIPCERTRRFATSTDGQTSVRVRVAQGERTQFVRNTLLGEIELVGLRPANRGEVTIAVTFELDPGGNLKVRALDIGSGQQAHAILQLVTVADDEPSIASMINRLAAIPVSSRNPNS